MNEFGTNYNRSICNKIEVVESLVLQLGTEVESFRQNGNAGFTDYDRRAIGYSMDRISEAQESLHQSLLNLKSLLG